MNIIVSLWILLKIFLPYIICVVVAGIIIWLIETKIIKSKKQKALMIIITIILFLGVCICLTI